MLSKKAIWVPSKKALGIIVYVNYLYLLSTVHRSGCLLRKLFWRALRRHFWRVLRLLLHSRK